MVVDMSIIKSLSSFWLVMQNGRKVTRNNPKIYKQGEVNNSDQGNIYLVNLLNREGLFSSNRRYLILFNEPQKFRLSQRSILMWNVTHCFLSLMSHKSKARVPFS